MSLRSILEKFNQQSGLAKGAEIGGAVAFVAGVVTFLPVSLPLIAGSAIVGGLIGKKKL